MTVVASLAELPGRMTGDGHIDAGGRRHDFELNVRDRGNGVERGRLHYRVRGPQARSKHHHFVSTSLTGVTFSDNPAIVPGRAPRPVADTVDFAGAGKWDGAAGYTFEARATDAGEPGRGRDRFGITIKDAFKEAIEELLSSPK